MFSNFHDSKSLESFTISVIFLSWSFSLPLIDGSFNRSSRTDKSSASIGPYDSAVNQKQLKFQMNFNWLEALNYFLSKSVTTSNFSQKSRFRFQFSRNYLQFIGVCIMIRVSANHHWAKMTCAILAVIGHFGETNCGDWFVVNNGHMYLIFHNTSHISMKSINLNITRIIMQTPMN